MKFLQVTMPDLSVWQIPLEIVARDRADCYAKDFNERKEEFEAGMNGDVDLIDWARNNMNWKNVSKYARKIHSQEPDFDWGWANGNMKIQEVRSE